MSDVDFSKIIEMSQEKLENPKINKNSIRSRCPLCGDSKTKKNVRRFYIDYYPPYSTYIGKCFRCGDSLNIISLYAHLYDVSYVHAKYELEGKKYNDKKIKQRAEGEIERKNREEESYEVKQSPELDINIEKECYSVDSTPTGRIGERYIKALKQFQEERGITGCFVGHSGKYAGRVIIPIYQDGELVYFQGRSLFDEMLPKYLNPAVDKEDIILNKENFDYEKSIVVTEGIIDAYMIGNQGTSLLGAYVNDNFLFQLRKYTKEKIILALDNFWKDSASYEQLERIIEKSNYSNLLRYFIFPKGYREYKDINDLVMYGEINKDEIFDFVIENSVTYSKMKVILKWGG